MGAFALAGVLAVVLGGGCADRDQGADESVPVGLQEEVVRGPVTVRLRTDRQEMTIADRLRFIVDVEYPEGAQVHLPPLGDYLAPFLVRDAATADPVLCAPGRLRLSRTHVLDPVVSGTYTIRSFPIRFSLPDEDPAAAHVVETPEMSLEVASLLPEDVAALDVADIVPPRELPPTLSSGWVWWVSGGFGALALAAAAWWWWRRRRGGASSIVPPAHELAYEELRRLVAADLVAQGRIKEFYQGISAILRRYIERRFGLHAPERTTEEFLAEVGQGGALPAAWTALLRDFLQHCDLVKFAELTPENTQIQMTFDTCRNFIEQTRADAATAAGGGGQP